VLKGIARHSLVLFAGDALARLMLFAATVWIARTLRPEAFGIVTFAQAVQGYLLLAGDWGMSIYGLREMATADAGRRAVWATVTTLRAGLTSLGVAIALVVTWLVPANDTTRTVVTVTLLGAVPLALVPDWACRAVGRMGWAATLGALQPALLLVGALLLVHGPADAPWVPAVRLVAAAVAAAVGTAALARLRFGDAADEARAARVTWREWLRSHPVRAALRSGAVLLAANAAVLAYNSGDSLLLKLLSGDRAVGLYGSAYRVVQVPLAAFNAVTFAAFPVLARLHRGNPEAVRDVTGRLVGWAFVAGVVVAAALSLLSGPLVRALYGEAYAPAAAALAVLAFVVPLDFLVSTIGTSYVASGLERPLAVCAGAAAVLNLAANVLLIPRFGMLGAAWATIGTYVVLYLLYAHVVRRLPR
jgi:O-antigen/teichoic acid export membrane protein